MNRRMRGAPSSALPVATEWREVPAEAVADSPLMRRVLQSAIEKQWQENPLWFAQQEAELLEAQHAQQAAQQAQQAQQAAPQAEEQGQEHGPRLYRSIHNSTGYVGVTKVDGRGFKATFQGASRRGDTSASSRPPRRQRSRMQRLRRRPQRGAHRLRREQVLLAVNERSGNGLLHDVIMPACRRNGCSENSR